MLSCLCSIFQSASKILWHITLKGNHGEIFNFLSNITNIFRYDFSSAASCFSHGSRNLINSTSWIWASCSQRVSWQSSHGFPSRRMVRVFSLFQFQTFNTLLSFKVPILLPENRCHWTLHLWCWFGKLLVLQGNLCDGAWILYWSFPFINDRLCNKEIRAIHRRLFRQACWRKWNK